MQSIQPIRYFLLLGVMLLAGCGGGGGGSPATSTQPPIVLPVEPPPDPSIVFPSAAGTKRLSDSLIVTDNGTLTSEAPTLRYTTAPTLFGWTITSGTVQDDATIRYDGLDIVTPPLAVRQEWAAAGQAGLEVNMLIMDSFDLANNVTDAYHGYAVTMSAAQIAPNANYYGMLAGTCAGMNAICSTYGTGRVRSARTSAEVSANTRIDVINMSFGAPIDPTLNGADITDTINTYHPDLTGTGTFLRNSGDAVIVKSAGNINPLAENYDPFYDNANNWRLNAALLTDPNTMSRTLLVGALNSYVNPTDSAKGIKPSIAFYSVQPGTDLDYQARFLVDYGNSPFSEHAYACLSSDGPCSNTSMTPPLSIDDTRRMGTSFAAPRVAGYAALYREKFPSQSGADIATRMLNTATLDGLYFSDSHCNADDVTPTTVTNCRQQFGQGRVNFGAALSPQGTLR